MLNRFLNRLRTRRDTRAKSDIFTESVRQSTTDAMRIVALIRALTDNEGSSVEIASQNVDFNDMPNECVSVTDAWTDWRPKSFRADKLVDCLTVAYDAKLVAQRNEAQQTLQRAARVRVERGGEVLYVVPSDVREGDVVGEPPAAPESKAQHSREDISYKVAALNFRPEKLHEQIILWLNFPTRRGEGFTCQDIAAGISPPGYPVAPARVNAAIAGSGPNGARFLTDGRCPGSSPVGDWKTRRWTLTPLGREKAERLEDIMLKHAELRQRRALSSAEKLDL